MSELTWVLLHIHAHSIVFYCWPLTFDLLNIGCLWCSSPESRSLFCSLNAVAALNNPTNVKLQQFSSDFILFSPEFSMSSACTNDPDLWWNAGFDLLTFNLWWADKRRPVVIAAGPSRNVSADWRAHTNSVHTNAGRWTSTRHTHTLSLVCTHRHTHTNAMSD